MILNMQKHGNTMVIFLGWSYSIYGVHEKDILTKALEAVQKAIALDSDYAMACIKSRNRILFKNFEQMLKDGERALELVLMMLK